MATPEAERYIPRLDNAYFDGEAHPYLGSILLKSKMLSAQQLDEALDEQLRSGKRLGEVLVDRGWLFPQDIARALGQQFGMVYVDIQHISVDLRAASCLDPEIGQRLNAIPVRFLEGGGLLIAVADPTSEGLSELKAAVRVRVEFAVTEPVDIRSAWSRLLRGFQP
jgi:type IV pilus assembly protein PilB